MLCHFSFWWVASKLFIVEQFQKLIYTIKFINDLVSIYQLLVYLSELLVYSITSYYHKF